MALTIFWEPPCFAHVHVIYLDLRWNSEIYGAALLSSGAGEKKKKKEIIVPSAILFFRMPPSGGNAIGKSKF